MAKEKKLMAEETYELVELNLRREVTLAAVRIARNEQAIDMAERYQEQLTNIEKKIEAITGKPPAVRVGLKPGIVFGKVSK